MLSLAARVSTWLRTAVLATWIVLSGVAAVAAGAKGGLAVAGEDRARLLPPAGAEVADYENAGYRLEQEDGEARVYVSLEPVDSRSPFKTPEAGDPENGIERVARAVVLGASTEYEASSRVLSWVARNIEYRLDRTESQEPADVLERRSAYCTGVARLTVALLEAVGLEAREVAGYVAGDGAEGPQGFHRWVEIRLADVGRLFSDPLYSHHYVPANYLRLSGEMLKVEKGLEGILLERRDGIRAVDLSPAAGPGIRIRRNTDQRLAAALQISVESGGAGLAVLEGGSRRFRHMLVGGKTTFLGLEPGTYRLQVMVAGQGLVERKIEVVGRQESKITLAASYPPSDPPAAAPIVKGME